jgi:hypothetical protein
MTRPCVLIAKVRDTDPTYAKVYHRSNGDPQLASSDFDRDLGFGILKFVAASD